MSPSCTWLYTGLNTGAKSRCLVLQEEHHPSAMGIGQSKEGFSAFGIFNQCVSPMGKRLLRLWFRRPIVNLTAIKDRQVGMQGSSDQTFVLASSQATLSFQWVS